MPPWLTDVFNAVVGPGGAFVLLLLGVYFVWKLFREEQAENRENFETVAAMSPVIKQLVEENRQWQTTITTRVDKLEALVEALLSKVG